MTAATLNAMADAIAIENNAIHMGSNLLKENGFLHAPPERSGNRRSMPAASRRFLRNVC
jgi:hypothetical protein